MEMNSHLCKSLALCSSQPRPFLDSFVCPRSFHAFHLFVTLLPRWSFQKGIITSHWHPPLASHRLLYRIQPGAPMPWLRVPRSSCLFWDCWDASVSPRCCGVSALALKNQGGACLCPCSPTQKDLLWDGATARMAPVSLQLEDSSASAFFSLNF